MNITKANIQTVQANSYNLQEFVIPNELQNQVTPLNIFQKRRLWKSKLNQYIGTLSKHAYAIATELLENCNNETFICYHSISYFMRYLPISRRSFSRALTELESLGLIERVQQKKKDKTFGTNKIRLICPFFTVRQHAGAQTTITKESISTKENTFSKNEKIEVDEIQITQPEEETFELTKDWHPSMQTINHCEEKLGMDYTERNSERISWVNYTVKKAGGKKVFLTSKQANAMFYHFCKTTIERRRQFESQGKKFMSMELRRNLAEQHLYQTPKYPIEPIQELLENKITDEEFEMLKKELMPKMAFKTARKCDWKREAYSLLQGETEIDLDLLEQERQRQLREGIINKSLLQTRSNSRNQ